MREKGSPRSPQGEAGFAPILIIVVVLAVIAVGMLYNKDQTLSRSLGQTRPTSSLQPTPKPYQQSGQKSDKISTFQERLKESCKKANDIKDEISLLPLDIEIDKRIFPYPRATCQSFYEFADYVVIHNDEAGKRIVLSDDSSKPIPRGGYPDFGSYGIPVKISKDNIKFSIFFQTPDAGLMGPDTTGIVLRGNKRLEYFYDEEIKSYQIILLTSDQVVMKNGDERLQSFLGSFFDKTSETFSASGPEMLHEFLNKFPGEVAATIPEIERVLGAVTVLSYYK